ncbi:unnamed protein product, partial [Rotaria sp. Silwood2]
MKKAKIGRYEAVRAQS